MSLDFGVIGGFVAGGAALSGALGVFMVPKIKTILVPEPIVSRTSHILSFESVLEDGITLKGKDGTLTQTILIKGVNGSMKTPGEIENHLNLKQGWLDSLSEMGASFKVITLRNQIYPQSEAGSVSPWLIKIHERWMSQFLRTFSNRTYIIITHHPKTIGKFGLFREKETANLGVLKELVSRTLDTLHEFEPKILDNGAENFSPLLSFWAELINGEPCKIGSYRDHISERLVSSTITFNPNTGLITYNTGAKKQYSSIISLMVWGEVACIDLLREIESLSGKVVVLQLCTGFTPLKAEAYLEFQMRQQFVSAKGNPTILGEFQNALEIIQTKESSLLKYQLSVFLFADSEAELEIRLRETSTIFRNYGIAPILETSATEWLWRSQFPGLDFYVKPTYPMSHNINHVIPFGREPVGLDRCDWGDGPIRLFKTSTGGIYSFQFHISEDKEANGHSLVVASTGKGKTTLFQHLIGGALRHPKLRAYIFDRYNGTRIFTQSMGGNYVDLSDSVSLNPLVCDDNPENRAFLQNFLLTLSNCDDPKSAQDAALAVENIFRVPKEERILKNLFQDLVSARSEFRTGLQKWAVDNALARWFNGAKLNDKGETIAFDSLNLGTSRLVGFEMTDVQESPETAGAVTSYIMHRIRSLARPRQADSPDCPHLIFMDEAKAMLADPVFAKNAASVLLEHRKLRGVAVLCFQTPESIIKSGISSIILEQCETQFFIPNPNADKNDYDIFKLTPFEWEYVKGISRISRALKYSVLVKRHQESVILDIDLKPLGSLVQLYRSGAEPLRLMRDLQQQWGLDKWVEKYIDC